MGIFKFMIGFFFHTMLTLAN